MTQERKPAKILANIPLTQEQQDEIKKIADRRVTSVDLVDLDLDHLQQLAPGLVRGVALVVKCW